MGLYGNGRKRRRHRPDPRRPQHTYAAIDLGTNNCRLLVARPQPRRLPRHRRLLAHRPPGRGRARQRPALRGDAIDAHPGGAQRVRRQDAPARRRPRPLHRHRGLPAGRATAPTSWSGCARETGLELEVDRRRRGGPPGGRRLPAADRALGAPCPGVRHRRRLDRDHLARGASRRATHGGSRPGSRCRCRRRHRSPRATAATSSRRTTGGHGRPCRPAAAPVRGSATPSRATARRRRRADDRHLRHRDHAGRRPSGPAAATTGARSTAW